MTGMPIGVCTGCGYAVFPPRLVCARCGASEQRIEVSETGTVEQVTTVVHHLGGSDRDIVLAIVRSSLGPVVVARLAEPLPSGTSVVLEVSGRGPQAKPTR